MSDANDTLQMNDVLAGIEQAFGPESAFTAEPVSEPEKQVLAKVFGDDGYQDYLQDQINRQVIRDYLLNARILGFIDKDQLEEILHRAASFEGRAVLALHMIMRSVEEAWNLAQECGEGSLQVLRPVPGSPPQLELIPQR
ncbi:hypothetical protein [Parahalioglobus pacificus]|uniref:Uncharacterized protein n=1 Tax=Parahalioglobus pacificus TaxID=930806 RepID=A0A919CLY9_9GAMM|nr:hypothetical protein [Halioglobus pacificus]NQY03829.1 hypothetical protein [Halieaceae bacterium]GHD34706.1 hypothetical protein GCM10007053_20790 [Halioglobus pacificus]